MDQIVIQDVEVSYRVGVTNHERVRTQRLTVSVVLDHDIAQAAAADDVTKTIDYFLVSRRILGFGEGRSWKLIETIAVDMCDMILREFKPTAVSVEIKKFVISEARWVSVRIRRPQS
jgi:dihydroneopterin aldolase